MKRKTRSNIRREKANLTRALETLHEQKSERETNFLGNYKLLIGVVTIAIVVYLLIKARMKGGLEAKVRQLAMLGENEQ